MPYVCGYSLRSDHILSLQKQAGIEIAVVSSARQPDNRVDEVINGIRYFRTPSPRLAPSPIREWQLMNALKQQVRRACREFAPDIIHAHSPVLVGAPAAAVARAASIPFVYEIRDLWENAVVDRGRFSMMSPSYRLARWFETSVLRRADAIVAIGENLQRELQARSGKDVLIVANGVDTESFQPLQPAGEWTRAWNPSGGPLLAYIGSFQPYEGLDVLVRAMPLIAARRSDVSLIVAGDGPERPALEQLAKDCGVESIVRFTGRVPHARVCEIYAVADLLVYPRLDTMTTRLTTPLKPLEALAMEKAVLASDLPALRELIADGRTGLMFKAADAGDLAAKALQLLDDPALRARLGRDGRAFVLESKQWRDNVARYAPLYERLMKQ